MVDNHHARDDSHCTFRNMDASFKSWTHEVGLDACEIVLCGIIAHLSFRVSENYDGYEKIEVFMEVGFAENLE